MTYFADLSAYTYKAGPDVVSLRPGPPPFRVIEAGVPRVNIGWLGRFHRRRTGATSDSVVNALLEVVASQMVNVARGYHCCHLCPTPRHPTATLLEWRGRTVSMGNGEIRIPAADGSVFAAPTLIGHYVIAHKYLPPIAFTDALIDYFRVAQEDLALGWIPQ